MILIPIFTGFGFYSLPSTVFHQKPVFYLKDMFMKWLLNGVQKKTFITLQKYQYRNVSGELDFVTRPNAPPSMLPPLQLKPIHMSGWLVMDLYLIHHPEPVTDPGFPPRWGVKSPGGCQDTIGKFSQKLHEIEGIWTQGKCMSLVPF